MHMHNKNLIKHQLENVNLSQVSPTWLFKWFAIQQFVKSTLYFCLKIEQLFELEAPFEILQSLLLLKRECL